MHPDIVKAAGGIVWRDSKIAVVHRRRYDDYTLPKGKLEPRETFETAALREVKEETGYEARILGFLTVIDYPVDDHHKVVVFYQMEAVRQSGSALDEEVAEVHWEFPERAMQILQYELERDTVELAAGLRSGGTGNMASSSPETVNPPSHAEQLRPFERKSQSLARLSAVAASFEDELKFGKGFKEDKPPDCRCARFSFEALRKARSLALEHGDVDSAWHFVYAAQEASTHCRSERWLALEAQRLRTEAETKLSEWRRDAVLDFLPAGKKKTEVTVPADPPRVDPDQVSAALSVMNGRHQNTYRKLALMRRQMKYLGFSLCASLTLLVLVVSIASGTKTDAFSLSFAGSGSAMDHLLLLGGILSVGALGGCLAAIIDTARRGTKGLIPDLLREKQGAVIRPAFGAASALAVVFLVQNGVVNVDIGDGGWPALAVLGGFSETLLTRAVGARDGKAG